MTTEKPRVPIRLPGESGPSGNAYSIMGLWSAAARKAGWTNEQIHATLAEATAGDYKHLRAVLKATTVRG